MRSPLFKMNLFTKRNFIITVAITTSVIMAREQNPIVPRSVFLNEIISEGNRHVANTETKNPNAIEEEQNFLKIEAIIIDIQLAPNVTLNLIERLGVSNEQPINVMPKESGELIDGTLNI